MRRLMAALIGFLASAFVVPASPAQAQSTQGMVAAANLESQASNSILTPNRLIAGIPDVIQMNNYSCGVAVVQGVLNFYGIWGYQETYAKELGTTKEDGTHPLRMVEYLRKRGLDASFHQDLTLADLRSFVDASVPVIVDFQAWDDKVPHQYAGEWEDGHYGIVAGYNQGYLFIKDPSLLGTLGYLENNDFLARWHDYETESGKRVEYRNEAIVVRGPSMRMGPLTHID